MSTYIDTCPQRAIKEVHHTTQTWLPVTLDCGHTIKINWTARIGQTTGCTTCQHAIEDAGREEYQSFLLTCDEA